MIYIIIRFSFCSRYGNVFPLLLVTLLMMQIKGWSQCPGLRKSLTCARLQDEVFKNDKHVGLFWMIRIMLGEFKNSATHTASHTRNFWAAQKKQFAVQYDCFQTASQAVQNAINLHLHYMNRCTGADLQHLEYVI